MWSIIIYSRYNNYSVAKWLTSVVSWNTTNKIKIMPVCQLFCNYLNGIGTAPLQYHLRIKVVVITTNKCSFAVFTVVNLESHSWLHCGKPFCVAIHLWLISWCSHSSWPHHQLSTRQMLSASWGEPECNVNCSWYHDWMWLLYSITKCGPSCCTQSNFERL